MPPPQALRLERLYCLDVTDPMVAVAVEAFLGLPTIRAITLETMQAGGVC